MDRGRVGYDLVANRAIREKSLANKRKCHKDRLKKIMHRAPGSSSTLDNTVPTSISNEMIAKNPRKKKIKEERAVIVERENRALLQRISMILTAPPKVTDDEYQKMKKLSTRLKVREKFEEDITKKRMQVIKDRISSTGAYYNAKEWEIDYKRQLEGQKFMRKVRYERPKDFIDPFAPPKPADDDEESQGGDVDMEELLKEDVASPVASGSADAAKGGSHIGSLRALKKTKSEGVMSPHRRQDGVGPRSKSSPGKKKDPRKALTSAGSALRKEGSSKDQGDAAATGSDTENGDDLADDDVKAINKSTPKLMAHMHRHVSLSDGRRDFEFKRSLPYTDVLADVQCWRKEMFVSDLRGGAMSKKMDIAHDEDPSKLIDSKSPPYSAVQVLEVGVELLEGTQRETSVLLVLKKLSDSWRAHLDGRLETDIPIAPAMTISDAAAESSDAAAPLQSSTGSFENTEYSDSFYRTLAQEVASSLNVVVEDDLKGAPGNGLVLRIVLPPHFACAETQRRVRRESISSADHPVKRGYEQFAMSFMRSSVDLDEDASAASIDNPDESKKAVVRRGIRIPFDCTEAPLSNAGSSSTALLSATGAFGGKHFHENVHVLIKLKDIGDEKARVSVTVLGDFYSRNVKQRSKKPTIASESSYSLIVSLPSVMAVDSDLVREFFTNLLCSVKLLYDRRTGNVNLTLKE